MKRIGVLCLTLLSCGRPEPLAPVAEAVDAGPCGPCLVEEEAGDRPKLFSPGFVSAGLDEREPSLSPDGRSLYYWIRSTIIEDRRRERVP